MKTRELRSEVPATQTGGVMNLSNQPAAADSPCWMAVDDDAGILKYLAPAIEAIAGVETCSFTSAVEALKAFEAAPHRFQGVVTDLDMPRMSGIEFCQQLRSRSPQLKVLLVTGCGFISRKEALEFGFCEMVAKPFTYKTLEQTIEVSGMMEARSGLRLG